MKIKEINKLLELSNSFSKELEEERIKAPYQLNIIDELRINENSHSRILGKILKYDWVNNLDVLQSFYQKLGISTEPKNPKVWVEKDRMDISIYDDDYIII